MMSASSLRRSECSSPTRRTSAARSATVAAFDHSRCARSARSIASRRSPSLIVGYSLTVSPVAGSTTAYMLVTSLLRWSDSGRLYPPPDSMERVLGIGGHFLRASDPAALSAWYRDCLGVDADQHGLWRQEAGPTVFASFESETDYFGSRTQQVMLNFRVRDLDAM